MLDIKLEPLPFEEAIEYFRDKVPLSPDQYQKLADEYKAKAFTVGGIAALDILNDILKELLKALEEGLTQDEFRERINETLKSKGWDGLSPYRADNIFRTNIQTAFSVGRYRKMTDPEVLARRPYWMYDAVNDTHTRPTHKALDGMVFPADHPFWDTWYPPNGYR
ncbi:MAG: phage head morphogenesis protein [Firmicutes bacterium]|nr:phage head morphogenesis protein [Bacillota bacterium]